MSRESGLFIRGVLWKFNRGTDGDGVRMMADVKRVEELETELAEARRRIAELEEAEMMI